VGPIRPEPLSARNLIEKSPWEERVRDAAGNAAAKIYGRSQNSPILK
jgi:hypothetical protein